MPKCANIPVDNRNSKISWSFLICWTVEARRDHNKQRIKILLKKTSFIFYLVRHLNEAIFSIQPNLKVHKICKSGSRRILWKKGRLWKFVSPWILNDTEFNIKPVILSPTYFFVEIRKQNILKLTKPKNLLIPFFLTYNEAPLEGNKKLSNCNHSKGPSSCFNKSNHVVPIKFLPKGNK